jgi:N-methylhydantoinase B/oxoprolinase/acetone carboxylase alpha subunit
LRAPVAVLRISTCALATGLPDGSVTRPDTAPVVVPCAWAAPANTADAISAAVGAAAPKREKDMS